MGDARTISARLVYEGKTFDVAVERVALPHGTEADVEVVRHEGSVVLIPETADGRIVLVRQYRHPAGRYLWEVPAGTLETGEDPETAARRECQEELGQVAGQLERLETLYSTPGFCSETMTFYRVTGLRAPGPDDPHAEQDADEAIETGTFSRAEMSEMVARGDIADLKTVAALALLQR